MAATPCARYAYPAIPFLSPLIHHRAMHQNPSVSSRISSLSAKFTFKGTFPTNRNFVADFLQAKLSSSRLSSSDFAKAFDHVDHNILIARLTEFGLPNVIIQWTCSFLRHRRQRVKIGELMSDWLVMNAGMPQGSYLGPLTFITLVDSLRASCMTHKYVDDTTLSEIVAKSGTSNMQVYCDELAQQSEQAQMNINSCKTLVPYYQVVSLFTFL